MKSNYIASFTILLLQCHYLSTKVTPLFVRSLWPSPVGDGDRYRGVRLYSKQPILGLTPEWFRELSFSRLEWKTKLRECHCTSDEEEMTMSCILTLT